MKQTVKETGGVPAGETVRDLRREVARSAPMGDRYDVTTKGTNLREVRTFGGKRFSIPGWTRAAGADIRMEPTWCLHDGIASFRVPAADPYAAVTCTVSGYVIARKGRNASTITLHNQATAATHISASVLEWCLCKVTFADGRVSIVERYHVGPFDVAATV
jgi:hypothetical protein